MTRLVFYHSNGYPFSYLLKGMRAFLFEIKCIIDLRIHQLIEVSLSFSLAVRFYKLKVFQKLNFKKMKQTVNLMITLFAATFIGSTINAQKPASSLLTPTNHALVLIDYESQMAFAVKNIEIDELKNNTAIVAGASKIFNVPTVVTTVAEKSFSGPVFPEIAEFYPVSPQTILTEPR